LRLSGEAREAFSRTIRVSAIAIFLHGIKLRHHEYFMPCIDVRVPQVYTPTQT
jgi:hypothetical protein